MTIFPYQKDSTGEYFPIINNIRLVYKNKIINISALIDSGATISVFKPDIASFLGLDTQKGKEIYLGGVGGRIKGYLHNLPMNIADKNIIAPVVFSYEYTVSLNLLGRTGIFKHYKILFDENKLLVRFE